MAKFKVIVEKISTQCFGVEADNYEDAKAIAIDAAYHCYCWDAADYEVIDWEEADD